MASANDRTALKLYILQQLAAGAIFCNTRRGDGGTSPLLVATGDAGARKDNLKTTAFAVRQNASDNPSFRKVNHASLVKQTAVDAGCLATLHAL